MHPAYERVCSSRAMLQPCNAAGGQTYGPCVHHQHTLLVHAVGKTECEPAIQITAVVFDSTFTMPHQTPHEGDMPMQVVDWHNSPAHRDKQAAKQAGRRAEKQARREEAEQAARLQAQAHQAQQAEEAEQEAQLQRER